MFAKPSFQLRGFGVSFCRLSTFGALENTAIYRTGAAWVS